MPHNSPQKSPSAQDEAMTPAELTLKQKEAEKAAQKKAAFAEAMKAVKAEAEAKTKNIEKQKAIDKHNIQLLQKLAPNFSKISFFSYFATKAAEEQIKMIRDKNYSDGYLELHEFDAQYVQPVRQEKLAQLAHKNLKVTDIEVIAQNNPRQLLEAYAQKSCFSLTWRHHRATVQRALDQLQKIERPNAEQCLHALEKQLKKERKTNNPLGTLAVLMDRLQKYSDKQADQEKSKKSHFIYTM